MPIHIHEQAQNFKNHIATLTDYGNIKILDFQKPDSSFYRIRFLFDEERYQLHISGDLGDLVAFSPDNMTYAKFSTFTNDAYYFASKVTCHSRPLYYYVEDIARLQLERIFQTENVDTYGTTVDEAIDEILEFFDEQRGISQYGSEIFCDLVDDGQEYLKDIGKEKTNILELYLLAFQLAQQQLKEKARIESETREEDDMER